MVGADSIIVLSHQYWIDHMGGDTGVVGRTIMLNGQACEVVGVTPENFHGLQWGPAPALWVHAKMVPSLIHWDENAFQDRNWSSFRGIGRLAPGVSVAQAGAQLATVDQRIGDLHAKGSMDDVVTRVVPEQLSPPDPSVSGFLPLAAAVFLALVLMILMIACANVGNLLFTRAVTRQREMAIRTAMGASRGRLTRQLLTESMLLAVMGVYSVVAYSVSQRRREIGIRLALGAERRDIFKLVVRGGLNVIMTGLGVGLLVALGLSLVLSGSLVELSAFDLPVFGSVAGGLTLVPLLACYLPARRAMAVDPAVTLKCE